MTEKTALSIEHFVLTEITTIWYVLSYVLLSFKVLTFLINLFVINKNNQ